MAIKKISDLDELPLSAYMRGDSSYILYRANDEIPSVNYIEAILDPEVSPNQPNEFNIPNISDIQDDGGKAIRDFRRFCNALIELSFPNEDLNETDQYDEEEYYKSQNINLSAFQDAIGLTEAFKLALSTNLSVLNFFGGPVLSGRVVIGNESLSHGYKCSTNQHQEDVPVEDTPDPDGVTSTLSVLCPTDFTHNVTFHCNETKIHTNKLHVDGYSTFDGLIKGTAMKAQWADLAEMYEADNSYEPGTLVKFGGEKEITVASGNANAVITKNPGFLLNESEVTIPEKHMVGIALTGRTPVRIIGPVKKFDKIVLSATPGVGIACKNPEATPSLLIKNDIIGRALEDNDDTGIKLVECVVQMNLN